MKAEYDFSSGKRGALFSAGGKTRITIYIDNEVLEAFRDRAEKAGTGYQTMMNDALRAFVAGKTEEALTESTLRRIIREELPSRARSVRRSITRSAKRRVA
jgi:hypothetical protein